MHCGAAAGGHPALEDNGTSLMETQGPACSPSPPPIRAGGRGGWGGWLAQKSWLPPWQWLSGRILKGRHNRELGTPPRGLRVSVNPAISLTRNPGPVIPCFRFLVWLPCGCGERVSRPEAAESFSSVLPFLPDHSCCFLTLYFYSLHLTSRPYPSSPGPSQ